MQLTLIRHLPTEWNTRGILQGNRDIDLADITQEYQEEIERNKKLMSEFKPFSTVLSSSLRRTQQTAVAYGFEFQIEPLLDELHFGEFEGQPKKKLIERYQDKWTYAPREIVLGEGLIDFEKRVVSFIQKYSSEPSVLIFGHGSWIRACISIHRHGSINEMNRILLRNNELVSLNF